MTTSNSASSLSHTHNGRKRIAWIEGEKGGRAKYSLFHKKYSFVQSILRRLHTRADGSGGKSVLDPFLFLNESGKVESLEKFIFVLKHIESSSSYPISTEETEIPSPFGRSV